MLSLQPLPSSRHFELLTASAIIIILIAFCHKKQSTPRDIEEDLNKLEENQRWGWPTRLSTTIPSFHSSTKVCRMKDTIASRLAGLIHNPFVFDGVHCGPLNLNSQSSLWSQSRKWWNSSTPCQQKRRPWILYQRPYWNDKKALSHLWLRDSSICTSVWLPADKLAQVSPRLKNAGIDVNHPEVSDPYPTWTPFLKS